MAGRSQDRGYTGTVLQVGSKVARIFIEGDHVTGHTHVATPEGRCVDVPGVTKVTAYPNQWKRVSWSLNTR